MSNTYHIGPTDELAPQAAPLVAEISARSPDAWIAVRGEMFNDEPVLYTVSELETPDGAYPQGYLWHYVRASEWLREFQASNH